MMLDKQEVKNYLPHRDPFLFVDGILAINLKDPEKNKLKVVEKEDLVDGEVIAKFYVSPEMDVFRGHFPNNPVLPGVLQIEMMAQTACFGLYKLFEDPSQSKLEVALVKVEESKFRRPVLPDTSLIMKAKCIKIRGTMVWHECSIENENGEVFSQAKIMATVK